MADMKLTKAEIKKEVEHAISMTEEIKEDAGKMDIEDIEDYANRIQLVLKRIMKDWL